MTALGEQMQVDFAQGGQEAIRVGDPGTRAPSSPVAHLQPIVDQVDKWQRHREQAGFDVPQRVPVVTDDRDDFARVRTECADDGVVAVLVGAQDGVRVVVRAGQQAGEVGRVGRAGVSSVQLASVRLIVPSLSYAATSFGDSFPVRVAC